MTRLPRERLTPFNSFVLDMLTLDNALAAPSTAAMMAVWDCVRLKKSGSEVLPVVDSLVVAQESPPGGMNKLIAVPLTSRAQADHNYYLRFGLSKLIKIFQQMIITNPVGSLLIFVTALDVLFPSDIHNRLDIPTPFGYP